jgi:hypothetical protein
VTGRATSILVPLVLAAFFAAFGALHYGFYTRGLLMDTPVYERYGDAIVSGGDVPYRNFAVEYPPGALPVFAAPSLVAPRGDFRIYRPAFEALMLLCGAVAAGLVGLILSRQDAPQWRLVSGTLLAGLAPLALGPVVLSRFDLWPAMLSVAALAALLADRRRLGSALLGVAIAAKLYPVVLLPLAVAYVWRRQGRREALVCTAWAVAGSAVFFVPFFAASPHGVWSSLSGQASRPLQIESLGAAFLLAAHQAFGLTLTQVSSHGSDNLDGSLPHALATVQGVLAPLVLLVLWIAFARGPATRERLVRYSAAVVCAFIAFSKVLSPQYLIWLIPLVPLVRGRRGVAAAVLFVASLVLTQLWFPRHYLDLAYGFDPRASWLVLARDLVLVALLLTLVWPRRIALALVLAGALAATGAAAAVVTSPKALAHTRVLDETGVATICGRSRPTPALDPGTVRYAVRGYENTASRQRCVRVTVRSTKAEPLFSAAYRDGFYPVDPGRNYLGDAGTCTNVAQHPASTVTYSIRVPARTRFAVEVEQCTSNRRPPSYSVRLTYR